MDYILTTNNLTKKYGSKNAADKINIHVKQGEIYGLIGRNGAGKTTILRMLSGLSIPTEGSYSLLGKTGKELDAEKSQVGTLIENPGLYPNLSAYENLKLKCIAMGVNSKEYINNLLSLVGLENTGKKKARNFSLGMRQRLGIALALAGNPKIIILDEPINGLDPQGIVEVREILTKLSKERGITIIISSHILDELSKIANSYGIIHEGKLIDEMTSQQLEKKCGEYVFLKTTDNKNAETVLNSMGISSYDYFGEDTIRITEKVTDTAAIVEKLVKSGVGVKQIALNHLSLEEYYLKLTGGHNNA
ncbi:MAG: ATP-binding cassette domain-containing protein [Ruminococcus sp.]